MAKDESVISASGYFDGQTSRGNFDVQLKAKFAPEELANALQFVAGIGKRIQLLAIVEDEKVRENVARKNDIFRIYGKEEFDAEAIIKEYKEYAEILK